MQNCLQNIDTKASAFYNLHSDCMLQKADVPQNETTLYKYLGYEISLL